MAEAVRISGPRLVKDIGRASAELPNDPCIAPSDEQQDYLRSFARRYSAADVVGRLDAARSTRVLVVGEAIIDEYHYCTPDAMSNKTPTLSARFESEEVFAGGVVAVANHLKGLCDDVRVLAWTGAQDAEEDLVRPFLSPGIAACTVARNDAPTVRKRRFVHRFLNQKLFEVTFLNDRPVSAVAEKEMISTIDEEAAEVDLVVALDFGHGYFTPPVVERLRARSRFLAVNAQINSSNRGFNSVRKFQGADYASVDEYEIRLPFGDRYGPLRELIARLHEETACARVNVTLGDRGTLYFDGEDYHHAPVFTRHVVDTMGAGDALLAASALMVHAEAPPEMVPFVGNCMGGLMSQIVGHRTPVDAADLHQFIETLLR